MGDLFIKPTRALPISYTRPHVIIGKRGGGPRCTPGFDYLVQLLQRDRPSKAHRRAVEGGRRDAHSHSLNHPALLLSIPPRIRARGGADLMRRAERTRSRNIKRQGK